MILLKDTNYKLDLSIIDSKGDFVSGLIVTYAIYKSADNSLVTSGTMIEVGSKGIYQTSNISFSNEEKYRVEYTTPNKYENTIEEILVVETLGSKPTDIANAVWEEAIAGHLGGDKAGQHLEDADATADPSAVADAVWDELLSGHSTVGSFAELLKRIGGLCQENYRIFNPTYTTNNKFRQSCMTSGTIKIYPTATDVDTDTNSIATYEVIATYNNNAEMTSYKVKRTI